MNNELPHKRCKSRRRLVRWAAAGIGLLAVVTVGVFVTAPKQRLIIPGLMKIDIRESGPDFDTGLVDYRASVRSLVSNVRFECNVGITMQGRYLYQLASSVDRTVVGLSEVSKPREIILIFEPATGRRWPSVSGSHWAEFDADARTNGLPLLARLGGEFFLANIGDLQRSKEFPGSRSPDGAFALFQTRDGGYEWNGAVQILGTVSRQFFTTTTVRPVDGIITAGGWPKPVLCRWSEDGGMLAIYDPFYFRGSWVSTMHTEIHRRREGYFEAVPMPKIEELARRAGLNVSLRGFALDDVPVAWLAEDRLRVDITFQSPRDPAAPRHFSMTLRVPSDGAADIEKFEPISEK
ncbi:MAG: hypothetical protein K8R23_14800 [Chthoniobacter sp.]|nr:hypothetical protein [Chthoniobacter sp.]